MSAKNHKIKSSQPSGAHGSDALREIGFAPAESTEDPHYYLAGSSFACGAWQINKCEVTNSGSEIDCRRLGLKFDAEQFNLMAAKALRKFFGDKLDVEMIHQPDQRRIWCLLEGEGLSGFYWQWNISADHLRIETKQIFALGNISDRFAVCLARVAAEVFFAMPTDGVLPGVDIGTFDVNISGAAIVSAVNAAINAKHNQNIKMSSSLEATMSDASPDQLDLHMRPATKRRFLVDAAAVSLEDLEAQGLKGVFGSLAAAIVAEKF